MGNSYIDKYSILHFVSGILAYTLNIPFKWWFVINVLFEYYENQPAFMYIINNYLIFWPGGKRQSDTYINRITDVIFCMMGWILGQYITINKLFIV